MTAQAPEPPDTSLLLVRADELRRAERRAASARMVSVIGHLIGTPLNVIAGRAALVRSSPTPEAVAENSRRIEEQVERLAQKIRRLIDYFGLVEPTGALRPLSEILSESVALYRPVAERQGVKLNINASEAEGLRVDASLVALLLTTLLSLAIRTAPEGEAVSLSATERGPKTLAFELHAPGLQAPPGRLDRLEPPEAGVRYDAGALETLWLCVGLTKRSGGGLDIADAASGKGATIRFETAHG